MLLFIKSPPILKCSGGDLLFLLSLPAAAAICFYSHSKTPTRIIFKYLQYAYWHWGICLIIFLRFSVFSTKSKMAAKILWRMLELQPLPGFVLRKDLTLHMYWLVFGVISLIKTLIFLRFRILADISVLFILAIIKIWQYSYTPLLKLFLNICSMHIGPRVFAR